MRGLFLLEGKVIVITGGAGYLGSAMVEGMLDLGATVMVAEIVDQKPEEVIKNGQVYDQLYCIKCDVSSTESIKEMFQKTRKLLGKIDVLINCATYGAGYGISGTIEKMTDDDWTKGMDGAAGVTFRCIREAIPYFEENKGGNIVNIASMYGVVSPDPKIYGDSGQNNPVNYGAGKAAVIQLTKYCAAHLAKKNIRVNSVTPGPFPNLQKNVPEDFLANLSNKTMLGRVGEPKEIVGAIILLASEASTFSTGSNIVVDGGWTAW